MIHRFPVRVFYEDTDMGGIVYHANYLRYIERARSDWVRQLGNDQNAMRDAGIVWVVRRIEADYITTAKFEDELMVETTLREISGVRLTMDQIVKRGETTIFTAAVTAVCMNAAGRPVRLPAEIRALMQG
ncbi:tol-pal system-associated acyl-CoA thioesterase [Antarcticimicrobium sediminis]|uniref:Tol-pal system-associated acyl-CoA thioesterase n=1 Tax=Antarcticimicrobium sediminis TaxID=2546227 RepID=A0A4V2Z8C8_9RHOB|nr:tol-pal system-associated acyl-CoA thioesterase [Antarcticimicrobium sediminis]TDE39716.1 tol-pal system-associated acyl-CoA thioesterase [Antarcticimicrobium sediminis]